MVNMYELINLNSNVIMTLYSLYNSFYYKFCWCQQILKFTIEIESSYQELSKNVSIVDFHQLNWKLWLVMYFPL